MEERHQVVKESVKGELSYPDALPKQRGNLATIWECCAAAFFYIVANSLVYLRIEELTRHETIVVSAVFLVKGLFLFGTGSVVVRAGQFLEDCRHHLASRHGGSVFTLFKRAFTFPTRAVTVLAVGGLLWWNWSNGLSLCGAGELPQILLIASAALLARSLDMFASPLTLSRTLSEIAGLDYGSGMAESFYHGYLHIILPVTGDANKGVVERIENYIAAEQLTDEKFPVKKLFVLIPSSTYISCTLDLLSYGWMEPANSLVEQKFNVAGVVDRSYKNQVYKIRDPADPAASVVYVLAEGATPLKTLNDVSQSNHSYREHFTELTHQFFTTLRRKLESNEKTRGTCELLYYVDKDENGDNVNVGKLILERIRDIQARQRLKSY